MEVWTVIDPHILSLLDISSRSFSIPSPNYHFQIAVDIDTSVSPESPPYTRPCINLGLQDSARETFDVDHDSRSGLSIYAFTLVLRTAVAFL